MKTMIAAAFTAALMLAVPMGTNAGMCHVALTDLLDFDIAGVLYIDDRPGPQPVSLIGLAEGTGTWFYLESNSIPNLQAGGASVIEEVDGDYKTCDNADLLLL